MNPIDATRRLNELEEALVRRDLLIKRYDGSVWRTIYRLDGSLGLAGPADAQRVVWRCGRDNAKEVELRSESVEQDIAHILELSREPSTPGIAVHSRADLQPLLGKNVRVHWWDGGASEGQPQQPSLMIGDQLALRRNGMDYTFDWMRAASVEELASE